VELPHLFDPAAKRGSETARQQGEAVFPALAVAHRHLVTVEVDILDSQANAFEEAQAGAVDQGGHQPRRGVETAEDRADLCSAQDERRASAAPNQSHEC